MTEYPIFKKQNYSTSIVAAGRKRVETICCAHWHDCCEVELVLSGSGTHIINGIPYPIQKGNLYLLTTFDSHEYRADDPLMILGIMFDESLVDERIFEWIPILLSLGDTLSVNISDKRFVHIQSLFELVIREEEALSGEPSGLLVINDTDGYMTPAQKLYSAEPDKADIKKRAIGDDNDTFRLSYTYISQLLNCILIELVQHASVGSHIVQNDKIRQAILYMYTHYAEQLTLQDMAEHLSLNESYLCRLFRRTTGGTFKQTLCDLRLRHACRLLANTKTTLTDVHRECGFESYSNFMRAFHRCYGMTPTQFRRQYHTE